MTRSRIADFLTDWLKRAVLVLQFVVAATLIPALGLAIGQVAEEVGDYTVTETIADRYPAAEPTAAQVAQLNETAALLPDLGIEWRWAQLPALDADWRREQIGTRAACGLAFLKTRLVLLDPDCERVQLTVLHEWSHLAQAEYYGGGVPEGRLSGTSPNGAEYDLPIHEVVADCASLLLADDFGIKQGPRAYLQITGGCSPMLLVMAREIVTNSGVPLTPGTHAPLSPAGSGVA